MTFTTLTYNGAEKPLADWGKKMVVVFASLFCGLSTLAMTVAWGYPTNGATPFNLVFVIGGTTNLTQPQPDWPVIAEVVFTNTAPIVSNCWTFQAEIPGTNIFQAIRAASLINVQQEAITNFDEPSESP
jgi:hypothetical protein